MMYKSTGVPRKGWSLPGKGTTGGRLDHFKKPSMASFEIIGDIAEIEIIARGTAIHEIGRLREQYGEGRWRKLKGIAMIRLTNGQIRRAEIHWYEAHGIGKKEFKRKRYLD